MTNNGVTTTDLVCAEILWKSADALRGQIDAAEYKHVVLGLLFLKYISDSFETRRGELKGELEADGISGSQIESLLENRDEYTAERVFWVPAEARWTNLQNQAARPDIAKLIDDAILAVERDNTNLKSKLPRDYACRGIARVGETGAPMSIPANTKRDWYLDFGPVPGSPGWDTQYRLHVLGGLGVRLFLTPHVFVAPEARIGLVPLFRSTVALGYAF